MKQLTEANIGTKSITPTLVGSSTHAKGYNLAKVTVAAQDDDDGSGKARRYCQLTACWTDVVTAPRGGGDCSLDGSDVSGEQGRNRCA